jgi:putative ABC transport system substrate-binding protein
LVFAHLRDVADLALQFRLPAISIFPQFAEEGGLIGYGPNVVDLFRRAARYVDQILKGAKPSDLPIQRPVLLDFAVNLKTAKALGLTIPPSLLQRADQVIE